MDEFLAKLYGTDELVKEASQGAEGQDELVQNFVEGMENLCKQAGIDPESLSDEEIKEAWDAYIKELSGEGELGKYASLSKEAWEQADVMGRIMAHAYVQELANLQKEAGKKVPTTLPWETVKKIWGSKRGKALLIGAPAAVAAGVPAAVYGLKKGKKKKASYDDPEVQAIAYNMLKEAGYVDENGDVIPPAVVQWFMKKQAQEAEKKEEKKEEKKKEEGASEEEKKEAALDLLEELGYPVVTE